MANGNNGNGNSSARQMWFQICGTVIAALILAGLAFVYNGISDLRNDFNNMRTEIVKVQSDIMYLTDDFSDHEDSEAHLQAIRRLDHLTSSLEDIRKRLEHYNMLEYYNRLEYDDNP